MESTRDGWAEGIHLSHRKLILLAGTIGCPSRVNDRDRGEPRGSAPPTPPYVRVRIRRFGGLSSMFGRQGCRAERGEEGVRQGDGERRAVAEPPRAMWATGGLRRQIPADAAASQPRKAGRPA